MGKYSELYRNLTYIARSGDDDRQNSKDILEAYPEYSKMNPTILRGKLRLIRQMLCKNLKKCLYFYPVYHFSIPTNKQIN